MNDKDNGLLPLGNILKQVVPRELRPYIEVRLRRAIPGEPEARAFRSNPAADSRTIPGRKATDTDARRVR
jgi:hypothetical protein